MIQGLATGEKKGEAPAEAASMWPTEAASMWPTLANASRIFVTSTLSEHKLLVLLQDIKLLLLALLVL